MNDNPRYLALKVLERVFGDGAFADKALFNVLKKSDLVERDRALTKELSFGAVRQKKRLDYLIAGSLDRDIRELDLQILNILRLGAYQICLMRIPDYAAVNEMVSMSKSLVGRGTDKLVNAVLRGISRKNCELGEFLDEIEELSVVKSHPRWIVEMWLKKFGRGTTEEICSYHNEVHPVTVRICSNEAVSREDLINRLYQEGIRSTPGSLEESVVINSGQDLSMAKSYMRGEFIVQSEASMMVSHAFDGFSGKYFIDLCAAPGGKTTHLAERVKGTGKVISVEKNRARALLIKQNAQRMGLENIEVLVGDAMEIELEPADAVLLDAPCTGLGVLSKRPDLRWRLRPEDIERLANLQKELLESAADMVRPGGILVYSTCTISAAENEDQISSFLKRHREFELENLPPIFERFLHPEGWLQFIPPRDGVDGFFIARMKKKI